MKYFNPSYWLNLWILSAPLFQNQNWKINAMPISELSNVEYTIEKPPMDFINENILYKNYHQRHKKREISISDSPLVKIWKEKNETCIHEVGHAIVRYFSPNIKDNLNYLEVYDLDNIKDNDGIMGKIYLKKYNFAQEYNDQELIESISTLSAGYLAEYLFTDNDFLPNLMDSSDWKSIKYKYEEIKKRNVFIEFNKTDNIIDDIWYLDDLIKVTIINAKKIINENQTMFKQIVEMCMLKSKVTKQDIDFIDKYKILPKEYLLIKKQFLKKQKEKVKTEYWKTKDELKKIDRLNLTEINSIDLQNQPSTSGYQSRSPQI